MNEEGLYTERVRTASFLQELTEGLRTRTQQLKKLKETESDPRCLCLLGSDIEKLEGLLEPAVAWFGILTRELAPRKEQLN
jgi:hypothetical protein